MGYLKQPTGMRSTANSAEARRRILVAVVTAAVVAAACLSATARGSETVKASVAFVPYKLGASTTIEANVNIASPAGELPSPLVKVELHFPQTLSFTSSTLGLATCDPDDLVALGQTGCPPNSRMGTGTSEVAVPFGPNVVREGAEMVAYMGPSIHEGVTVIIFGEGVTPISAQMLIEGSLVGGDGPFSKLLLESDVPLIPTLPGAKNVAMLSLHLDFGPKSLLYYERVHGHTVSFRPRGLLLPLACPAGGFPFDSTLTFEDGTVSNVDLVVPCPARGHKARTPARRAA